jgi:lipid II:glycine glycyltransferase (peptidoglycan interpeptide bridge formation enzyme)
MKDIRQSSRFAGFMKNIGWQVGKINSTFIYLKKFPIFGYFAKIPRLKPPFPFLEIKNLVKNKNIFQLKIAPFVTCENNKYKYYRSQFLNNGYKIENFPFNPTTDIYIDLKRKEKDIFNSFTPAKRRAVRRAIKNGIIARESDDLESFIRIRKKQYFPTGFLVVSEMKALWKNFYPKDASLILAYNQGEPVAGILLLFYDHTAYYWYASSLKIGKKLFAPTLLVWEALKVAKKRGCQTFVFEGIYDERFPKAAEGWKGFTKFKEGFGGKKVVYMENFYL